MRSWSWVPCSTIRPSRMTQMRLARRMVLKRWAMTAYLSGKDSHRHGAFFGEGLAMQFDTFDFVQRFGR